MASRRRNGTFFNRIQELLERHRTKALASIAVLVTLTLAAAQIFPALNAFIYSTTLIPYLTLIVVLDLARTNGSRFREENVRFMSNQDESFDDLLPTVAHCRQADLIEYAGATTLPLIRAIQRENVPMRLLMKHPDTVEGLQRDRMITTLDSIYNSIFKDHRGEFEIRCYKLPYSLRARHFHGIVLELGWLTPDPEHETAFGHQNPSAFIDLRHGAEQHFLDFFKRTFDIYWTHPETEDGLAVLQRAQSTPMRARGRSKV